LICDKYKFDHIVIAQSWLLFFSSHNLWLLFESDLLFEGGVCWTCEHRWDGSWRNQLYTSRKVVWLRHQGVNLKRHCHACPCKNIAFVDVEEDEVESEENKHVLEDW